MGGEAAFLANGKETPILDPRRTARGRCLITGMQKPPNQVIPEIQQRPLLFTMGGDWIRLNRWLEQMGVMVKGTECRQLRYKDLTE